MTIAAAALADHIVDERMRAVLRPGERLSVAEWADRYRVMPEGAPLKGRWRTSATPYLRGVMEAMSPSSPWRRVVVQKGVQIGGSAAALNLVGYAIHHAPAPIMWVLPTVEMAEDWSKTDLVEMIEACPVLRERIADPKSRTSGNTILTKHFRGGRLLARGSNSPAGMRRVSIRYLVLDDVDGFPATAGTEGDPVTLAMKRTTTYGDRAKVVLISTPTLKDASRIEAWRLRGNDCRYFVPCPFCGEMQPLEWTREDGSKGLVWPSGRPREARYQCRACVELIEDHYKPQMFAAGEWVSTAEGDGETWSCHLPSLLSPYGWTSWGEIAEQWVQAKGNREALQVAVNTLLAETWDPLGGETVDAHALQSRVESWGEDVPEQVAVITAGVAVHPGRLEVEIVGWGLDEESWSLEYRRLDGDPEGPHVWADLDEILLRRRRRADGLEMDVDATGVDEGYATNRVRDFCWDRRSRRVWPVKGMAGPRPIWTRLAAKQRRQRGQKMHPFIVGIDACKQTIYSRLRLRGAGRGYMHLGPHCDAEWCEQITAERQQRRTSKAGVVYEWILPPHQRNEALDCRVYALATLHGLYARGLTIGRRLEQLRAAAAGIDAPPRPPPPPRATPAPAEAGRRPWTGARRGWTRR